MPSAAVDAHLARGDDLPARARRALCIAVLVVGGASAACQHVARVGAHCASELPFAPFDARQSTATATSPTSGEGGAAATSVGAGEAPEATGEADPDGILDAMVAWYQVHARARALPGTGCPFAPTCSAYARTALRRYGPLGLVLIVDRLIVREHAVAGAYYPTICVAHTTRLVDGVP